MEKISHPGLYHGSCCLVFVLSSLACCNERYQGASQRLLESFCQHIVSWNWQADPFLRGQENFELIGGAAGILRILLMQADKSLVQPAFEQVCSYLLWASETPERWVHRPQRLSAQAREQYPCSYLDLGMAHGLAGPLAALSLAALHGLAPKGTHEAITRWASWLVAQRLDVPWGYDWPSVIPMNLSANVCQPSRTAWCYGAPGTRALAGRACTL